MSLSRSGKKPMKLLTNQRKPSPTYQNFFLNFARGSETSVSGGMLRRFIRGCFAEGSSLFTLLFRKVRAGMTVEASIVLPLFLFFILNMGSALEMIRLHGNLQLGLWDVGRKLTLYGYALESLELREVPVAELIFASTYVKGQLAEAVGEKYLDESPIVGGADGLMLLESEVLTDDDGLEITVTYGVRPFSGLVGNFGFRMANRYYAHLWTGYEIPVTEEAVAMAYLAENAQVYHLDRGCSHLALTVKQIHSIELEYARNNYGKRYVECKKCVAGVGDAENAVFVCYIAEDGDCYHWDAGCSGLKRTVYCVPVEEAKKYVPCSRCG